MQESTANHDHPFEFTGKGEEYFRIWIVNLLLTIVTLGVYSAWAKVRRLQYFYRNTRLDGASFDYHGAPVAILKGRIIAATLFVLYNVMLQINPIVGGSLAVLIALVMPWLIVRSLRFKLHNSSYRGLRFAFVGKETEAYKIFLLYPLLTVLTLYLLAPWTHQRIKQFQHNNSRFGGADFDFSAGAGGFYRIYLTTFGLMLLVFLLFVAAAVGLGLINPALTPFVFAALPLVMLAAGFFFAARLQNLVWNHTGLGAHSFHSRVQARRMLSIGVTNFFGIVLTLGLYIPYATIRMMRYRLECMSLEACGDLDEFVAGQEQAANATGEETAEMFDVDLSL